MNRFCHITAGYDLAQRVVKGVYGLEGYFDYPGPCDLGPLDKKFWERAAKPHKWTLLHSFIFDFEQCAIEEELHVVPFEENRSFLTDYIKLAGMQVPAWFSEKKITRDDSRLHKIISRCIQNITQATFQLLFRDVEFLFEFQKLIRKTIKTSKNISASIWLDENGNFARPKYLPRWLQNAVFYRDMGHCQLCGKDVTGQVYHYNQYHLDHLLPLSHGGCNDPTNFQLLCKECYLSKGGKMIKPKNKHLYFWDM